MLITKFDEQPFITTRKFMKFDSLNLNPAILKAITLCGYTTPTPIQAKAVPVVLTGKDIIASAQTGTGKTAAFVLPALQKISEAKARQPQKTSASKTLHKPPILILTPTRELAAQIEESAHKYGKFLGIKTVNLVGGMPYRFQLQALSRPLDIVIATPGRLMDHMQNKRLDLSGIEMLVLDEADRMLDMGFIDDVEQIAKSTPSKRQTLLFSATIDAKLARLARNILKDPEQISVEAEKTSPTKIEQRLLITDNQQHKLRLLNHLLKNENIFKAIIFSGTKINADNLARELHQNGHAVSAIHGDLRQSQRNRTIEQMKRGKIQILVATDVAARGIDIKNIDYVINYDLPKFAEDYVHRIGRTGRAGESGIAISFASPGDERFLQKIERYIGQRLTPTTIPGLEPTKHFKNTSGSHNGKRHSPNNSRSTKIISKKELRGRFAGQNQKSTGEGQSYSTRLGQGRSFSQQRASSSERTFSQERPALRERTFSQERPSKRDRTFSQERPASRERSFSQERPASRERSFSQERPASRERSFSQERPASRERSFSQERPASRERSFSQERPASRERSFSQERPPQRERTFSRTRPPERERTFSRNKPAGQGKRFSDKK
jgi:superfamily II DNA/RNA helicase